MSRTEKYEDYIYSKSGMVLKHKSNEYWINLLVIVVDLLVEDDINMSELTIIWKTISALFKREW